MLRPALGQTDRTQRWLEGAAVLLETERDVRDRRRRSEETQDRPSGGKLPCPGWKHSCLVSYQWLQLTNAAQPVGVKGQTRPAESMFDSGRGFLSLQINSSDRTRRAQHFNRSK